MSSRHNVSVPSSGNGGYVHNLDVTHSQSEYVSGAEWCDFEWREEWIFLKVLKINSVLASCLSVLLRGLRLQLCVAALLC